MVIIICNYICIWSVPIIMIDRHFTYWLEKSSDSESVQLCLLIDNVLGSSIKIKI